MLFPFISIVIYVDITKFTHFPPFMTTPTIDTPLWKTISKSYFISKMTNIYQWLFIGKVKFSTVGHRHSDDLLFPVCVSRIFHIRIMVYDMYIVYNVQCIMYDIQWRKYVTHHYYPKFLLLFFFSLSMYYYRPHCKLCELCFYLKFLERKIRFSSILVRFICMEHFGSCNSVQVLTYSCFI